MERPRDNQQKRSNPLRNRAPYWRSPRNRASATDSSASFAATPGASSSLGYDKTVEALCSGGFPMDVEFSADEAP